MIHRGILLFGPDMGTFAYTADPGVTPTPPAPPALSKPVIAVDLAGSQASPGKVSVEYNLAVYSTDHNAHLYSIIALALPVGTPKPATPAELFSHPLAVTGETDVSTVFTGGKVTVEITSGTPGTSYQGYTLLEFNRPAQAAQAS